MIAAKVDTVVVDAVDAKDIAPAVRKAKDAGIHVIAYDRLAEGPVDAYVGFDNELVGQTQGKALISALGGTKATKRDKVVMINGSPSDPNAAQFKAAARVELGNAVTVAKSYDTAGWKPSNAKANMEQAVNALGADNIAGVYVANDGMAYGVIEALKEVGVREMPPITGQDAELAAVQRILDGEQYMSVYKPYPDEAETAAEMAVRISQGATSSSRRWRWTAPTARPPSRSGRRASASSRSPRTTSRAPSSRTRSSRCRRSARRSTHRRARRRG